MSLQRGFALEDSVSEGNFRQEVQGRCFKFRQWWYDCYQVPRKRTCAEKPSRWAVRKLTTEVQMMILHSTVSSWYLSSWGCKWAGRNSRCSSCAVKHMHVLKKCGFTWQTLRLSAMQGCHLSRRFLRWNQHWSSWTRKLTWVKIQRIWYCVLVYYYGGLSELDRSCLKH